MTTALKHAIERVKQYYNTKVPNPYRHATSSYLGDILTVIQAAETAEARVKELERWRDGEFDNGDDGLYNVRRLRKRITELEAQLKTWKRDERVTGGTIRHLTCPSGCGCSCHKDGLDCDQCTVTWEKIEALRKQVAQLRARLEVSELARQACELREKHHFERIERAEAILFDLGTGYWVAILDDNDAPVNPKMGQRVLQYWKESQ